jgi:ADP-dependent NAD(P)H-hydrate dehydratase / NAD(P)H-hydrate epimerase
MPPLVRVVSARESAARDRAAIENGTPSRLLMQLAGTAAAQEILRREHDKLRSGALVFTGPGNNGGDGWVVAGFLARSGVEVTVIEAVEARSPDAVAEKDAAIKLVTRRGPDGARSGNGAGAGVVIDALLGTGAEGEPRDAIAESISSINGLRDHGARVVSLDVPSGLNATTGVHSLCVLADVTFTFGGLKRGSLIARDCCGEIVVIDIGIDETEADGSPAAKATEALPRLVDGNWVRSHIPPIPFDAHKGTRKHIAIVGGGAGMPGAVVLATQAAARSGAGLLRAFVEHGNADGVLGAVPFALVSEWPLEDSDLSKLISKWADAIVIGPGLGTSETAQKLVGKILSDSSLPVLLDADALNIFDGDIAALGNLLRGRQALITPHVAEFARLAKVTVQKVLDNRFDIGQDMARALNAIVLLKGPPTVIYTPVGERWVAARGTAALGTGGSGDVLSGVAGTFLAQVGDALSAACCAAWIHGRAAELCEYVRGSTIEDVLYALPRALNESERRVDFPVLTELPAVAK